MSYRIKTVSELTGIPKNTLVAWERRYNLLKPERQPNGYRTYSDSDVAVLGQLKNYLADGLKISEAVELVRAAQNQRPLRATAEAPDDGYGGVRDDLLNALLKFEHSHAHTIVQRMRNVSFRDLISQVYFPLLHEIGEGWQGGRISVAQEHFASSFLRNQLVGMLLAVGGGFGQPQRHNVCVTFPGERHELAVLALAVHLALHGQRVTYLGADLPVNELCRFSREHEPDVVYVSLIVPVPAAALTTYAEELRNGVAASVELYIGGAGLPDERPDIAGVHFLRDWRKLKI